jgi:non-canonical purine NTP pyrophosphatase (RdgB/HAM1 family)
MAKITFVTGNPKKAKYFSKCMGIPLLHESIDFEEVQSLDVEKVTLHKLEQAYNALKRPVLVEDLALEFIGLHGLPGTFIKFFLQKLSLQELSDLLKDKDRQARAISVIGFKDSKNTKLFKHVSHGTISEKPSGQGGFGWDPIYIPEGYGQTRGEMTSEDDEITFKELKPFDELKEFLTKCGY